MVSMGWAQLDLVSPMHKGGFNLADATTTSKLWADRHIAFCILLQAIYHKLVAAARQSHSSSCFAQQLLKHLCCALPAWCQPVLPMLCLKQANSCR